MYVLPLSFLPMPQELQNKAGHTEAVIEVMKADIKRLGGSTKQYGSMNPSKVMDMSKPPSPAGRRDSTASAGGGGRRASTSGHNVTFGAAPELVQKQAQMRGVVSDMDSKVFIYGVFVSSDVLLKPISSSCGN